MCADICLHSYMIMYIGHRYNTIKLQFNVKET